MISISLLNTWVTIRVDMESMSWTPYAFHMVSAARRTAIEANCYILPSSLRNQRFTWCAFATYNTILTHALLSSCLSVSDAACLPIPILFSPYQTDPTEIILIDCFELVQAILSLAVMATVANQKERWCKTMSTGKNTNPCYYQYSITIRLAVVRYVADVRFRFEHEGYFHSLFTGPRTSPHSTISEISLFHR